MELAHPCKSRTGERIPCCKTPLGFVLALMFGSVWSPGLTSPSSASTCTLNNSLFLWVYSLGLLMVLLQQLRLWMQVPPSLLLNPLTLQPSEQPHSPKNRAPGSTGGSGLGALSIFSALTQGHQQNILGMSGQTEAASIVFTKGRGGFGISVKG